METAHGSGGGSRKGQASARGGGGGGGGGGGRKRSKHEADGDSAAHEWPPRGNLSKDEHAAINDKIATMLQRAWDEMLLAHQSDQDAPLKRVRTKARLMAWLKTCADIEGECLAENAKEAHTQQVWLWAEASTKAYHYFAVCFRLLPVDPADKELPQDPTKWIAHVRKQAAAFGIEAYILGSLNTFNYQNYLSARAKYIAAYEHDLEPLTAFLKYLDFLYVNYTSASGTHPPQ